MSVVITPSSDEGTSEDEAAVLVTTRATKEVSPALYTFVWSLLFRIVFFFLTYCWVLVLSNIATIPVCVTSTCYTARVDCVVSCLWCSSRCGFTCKDGNQSKDERNSHFGTKPTTRQCKVDEKTQRQVRYCIAEGRTCATAACE